MKIIHNSIRFQKVLLELILSPTFCLITLWGNLLIASFSVAFYQVEKTINPNLNSLLDALWWGFATATTVGYGDIVPISPTGKIIGILLMLTGTALFALFTALFASIILENDLFPEKYKK